VQLVFFGPAIGRFCPIHVHLMNNVFTVIDTLLAVKKHPEKSNLEHGILYGIKFLYI